MSGCPLEIVLWPKTIDRYNYYYRLLTIIMIESLFVWLTARVCSLRNNFLFFGLCFCLFSANLMFSWLAFSFQSLIVLWELNIRTIIKKHNICAKLLHFFFSNRILCYSKSRPYVCADDNKRILYNKLLAKQWKKIFRMNIRKVIWSEV
jgi:hypothetical protein